MDGLQKLWTQMPLTGINSMGAISADKADASGDAASFFDIFSSAIDYVKETDAEKTDMQYLLATGQLDNPALLTIASSKAELAVDLLVQLRNKALDAYSELMRMSV